MAKFDDLTPCDYFGPEWSASLLAVGWLESRAQFIAKAVEAPVFDALTRLLCGPWQPFALAGRHRCGLCRFSGGPTELRYADRTIAMGSTNLFVLDERRAYVSPSLIVHYIDAHEYGPPEEFQEAVLRCPPPGSMDYLKLLRRHGLHRLGGPKAVPNDT